MLTSFSFQEPLPWSFDTKKKLLEAFNSTHETIDVHWWWEPFHRPGINAWLFMKSQQIPQSDFETLIQNLSASPNYSPEYFIQKTWQIIKDRQNNFDSKNLWLPKIHELKLFLVDNLLSWEPDLSHSAEFQTVSNWLTQSPLIMKRFQAQDVWSQINLVENLMGFVKDSSVLRFKRLQ